MVQELEENYQMASKAYQTLNGVNQRHIEEKTTLQERMKSEAAHWDKEKNKILDLFSSKLDLLHSHQASTLQELQITRLELGKVQDMLKPPEAEEEHQQCPLPETADISQQDDAAEGSIMPETESGAQAQSCADGKPSLEDAQARLESLKENLYKREREITQLLQWNTDSKGDTANQPPCSALLNAVILKGLDVAARHSEYFTTERVKVVGQQLQQLQGELQQVREENKRIIENYNSERIMRKKYYNIVEDMKGRIRVFCRIRPMSRTEMGGGGRPAVDCLDEYSVTVETPRGLKEFQFNKVFGGASSQEEVFQDTSRLIQSAIDGFNVCIFAYGQTGSGKTFTMIGDKDLKNPGIMPRAFRKLFEIIQENTSKFDFKVSAYMLELYNDRLLDLFVRPTEASSRKIEIKKDKKGLVFAQGAEIMGARSAEELFALFEHGCANRHIAATKINLESSRSHLIIGITIESTNLTNGSVSHGKLSLVDLAGSERAAKTGAKDDQLKEANSINKSLSALGDVIFALSTEQAHVPYRNNKLTVVMQDSLGGNAKTLMFVNISPSNCNIEETLTSLAYATRVKAITNNAQKNLESKEIAHLKEIILKLKSGQPTEEDV
ncbi:hypothetical protein AAFF_G00378510 [Aldrovandia affinis]|uniref:Kinesin-like protein n=1 Tax=Aldrovandia affinis TaxID=143900 RepID=A0AAD7WMJ5_9TELE|nr:hypothetical protein AAFF_G00378510 [Aldrovandia affinis]